MVNTIRNDFLLLHNIFSSLNSPNLTELSPVQNGENSDIAANNNDDRDEEDDTVEDGVVNVCPLDRRDSKEEEISSIAFQHRAREVLEEVVGGALVELLGWVLHQPEDDGLWAGEYKGQDPGDQDHQTEIVQVCKIWLL